MVFLTGFPGFLASALVPHLLERGEAPIACLVQPHFHALAAERAAALTRAAGVPVDRIRLVAGDLRRPGLGLDDAAALQRGVRAIFHLAAVYDLAVDAAVGQAVNVGGTERVLRFAGGCPHLERLHYVSTCYVSGRYEGMFSEGDLDVGQAFNNAYEETKFRAERAVQDAMQGGLPATIYRPAVVVGDSRTGATQKYDGPYYVVRWLLRWGRVAPLPVAPRAERFSVNVVPRDFVIAAMAHLSGPAGRAGAVYHLSDPAPLSVPEMLTVLERATGVRALRVPLSPVAAADVLARVPPLRRWVDIEPQAFRYFTHAAKYPCPNTLRDLADSGIACPPFASYADRLVDFVRAHPDVPSAAMV